MIESSRWFSRGPALAAAILFSFSSGCASDPEPKASHRKPPPPLAGQETFFDGRVLAELNVGAGPQGAPGGKPGEGLPSRGPGGGRHMGGGGGGHHGGGPGGGPGAPGGDPESAQIMAAQRAAAGGQPPVMIHLRLTNNGSERLDVFIPDFLSPLGNFVMEPSKLTLDPGQSQDVEPMTSRLAGDIEETTVTLTLHIAGRTEKKVVTLRVASPATPVTGPDPGSRPTQK